MSGAAAAGPERAQDAVEQYLVARRAAKPSPHTVAAYRRDLNAVLALVAREHGCRVQDVALADLQAGVLRSAFADFATDRAASSVVRAWSTWNGFFGFWVSERVVGGNPMSAVPRPRVRPQGPNR